MYETIGKLVYIIKLVIQRGEHWLFVQYDCTSMVTIAQYIAQLPIMPLHVAILCAIGIFLVNLN